MFTIGRPSAPKTRLKSQMLVKHHTIMTPAHHHDSQSTSRAWRCDVTSGCLDDMQNEAVAEMRRTKRRRKITWKIIYFQGHWVTGWKIYKLHLVFKEMLCEINSNFRLKPVNQCK
jgi:hypothetical protein